MYYQRNFGYVEANAQARNRLIGEIVVAFLAYFIASSIDVNHRSPVSAALLVVAVFLVAHWWLLARAQPHFLVLAGIVVVLSYVPLFEASIYHWLYMDKAPDWYGSNINVCASIVLLIAGLWSHWQMVRSRERVRERLRSHSIS